MNSDLPGLSPSLDRQLQGSNSPNDQCPTPAWCLTTTAFYLIGGHLKHPKAPPFSGPSRCATLPVPQSTASHADPQRARRCRPYPYPGTHTHIHTQSPPALTQSLTPSSRLPESSRLLAANTIWTLSFLLIPVTLYCVDHNPTRQKNNLPPLQSSKFYQNCLGAARLAYTTLYIQFPSTHGLTLKPAQRLISHFTTHATTTIVPCAKGATLYRQSFTKTTISLT